MSILREAWTLDGVEMAVKRIVLEDSAQLVSLTEMPSEHPEIYTSLKKDLFQGNTIVYRLDYPLHQQLLMHGFARKQDDALVIDNRIFEMRLYRYFISKSKHRDWMKGEAMEHTSQFTEDGATEAFQSYLSPILIGTGTYSVENRDARKGKIHYNDQRCSIELKIWHGERYNAKEEKQINRHLDTYGLKVDYMPSFSYIKTKEPCVKQVYFGDKLLYEGIVWQLCPDIHQQQQNSCKQNILASQPCKTFDSIFRPFCSFHGKLRLSSKGFHSSFFRISWHRCRISSTREYRILFFHFEKLSKETDCHRRRMLAEAKISRMAMMPIHSQPRHPGKENMISISVIRDLLLASFLSFASMFTH